METPDIDLDPLEGTDNPPHPPVTVLNGQYGFGPFADTIPHNNTTTEIQPTTVAGFGDAMNMFLRGDRTRTVTTTGTLMITDTERLRRLSDLVAPSEDVHTASPNAHAELMRLFEETTGQPVPEIIDTQPDPTALHEYLSTVLNRQGRRPIVTNGMLEDLPFLEDIGGDEMEQLTNNFNTEEDLTISTNRMDTPLRIGPDIPLIPEDKTPWRRPAVMQTQDRLVRTPSHPDVSPPVPPTDTPWRDTQHRVIPDLARDLLNDREMRRNQAAPPRTTNAQLTLGEARLLGEVGLQGQRGDVGRRGDIGQRGQRGEEGLRPRGGSVGAEGRRVPGIYPQMPPTRQPAQPPRVIPQVPSPAQLTRAPPIIPKIPPATNPARPMTMVVNQPPPPLPERNPYLQLSRAVIQSIARERDITLEGSVDEQAAQLYEFDTIMPDWIQSVLTKNIENFQVLAGTKLYVFGAINGISLIGLGGLQNRDLVSYIRVTMLLDNHQHPGRGCLSGLLNNLGRNVLELFAPRVQINPDHLRFIGTEELRTAIINGNRDHIAIDTIEIAATRYRLLTTHPHVDLLRELYNVDEEDDDWMIVARSRLPPHPLEAVILQFDTINKHEIASQFGMAIPLAHTGNIETYIRNNIVHYANVLTRQIETVPLEALVFMEPDQLEAYVSKHTDTEIFKLIGIYVAYDSRPELVQNIIRAIREPQFLYPVVRDPKRAHNQMTIGLTEITDTDTFMIGYGTVLKYYVYELDDILGAFHHDEERQMVTFRRPEHPRNKFTIRDVEELRRLLSCFAPNPTLTALITRIDDGIITAREHIAFDDIARTNLRRLIAPAQDLVRRYLRQIFYTGMYMRRWKGPGHPFPLKQDDTRAKEDPDEVVRENLKHGTALLEQMDVDTRTLCMTLKICQYDADGSISHENVPFEREWHQVGTAKVCIRMASSKFVGTGYHYLRALFRETIPGVDVKTIDRIT